MSEYIVRMPPDMPYEIKAELNAWYVNSEPIVRCRDCAYRDHWKYSNPKPDRDVCLIWECIDVSLDDFCSRGERKEAGA